MRAATAEEIAARAKENWVGRELVRIGGRDRSDNSIQYGNFWNDLYPVTVTVVDGFTGEDTDYLFVGAGSLVSVDGMESVMDQSLTVRSLSVTLGPLNADIIDLVRGYDLHEQPFQYWQATFDPVTRTLVSAASNWYVGTIDTVSIVEPEAEGFGHIDLSIRDVSADMTRKNTLMRSHASEILRNANDNFYSGKENLKNRVCNWGNKSARLRS